MGKNNKINAVAKYGEKRNKQWIFSLNNLF